MLGRDSGSLISDRSWHDVSKLIEPSNGANSATTFALLIGTIIDGLATECSPNARLQGSSAET